MKWMVALLLIAPSLFAQSQPDTARADSIVPGAGVPVVVSHDSTAAGTLVAGKIDTVSKYHPTKSAGMAMLMSAVLPGSGQFYNESYWKVPIVVGLGGYFVYQWLHFNKVYRDYRTQYANSVLADPPNGNPYFQSLREYYRDQRDTFTWYFFLLYLVNVADAYVDASLYDFSVSDNLSIRFMPMEGSRLGLRVSF
jgi:hypothetical protein